MRLLRFSKIMESVDLFKDYFKYYINILFLYKLTNILSLNHFKIRNEFQNLKFENNC